MNWLPIETAPKDRKNVLVFDEQYGVLVARHNVGQYWEHECDLYSKPTHWMPLPEPPK